jgi:hypothetical protein
MLMQFLGLIFLSSVLSASRAAPLKLTQLPIASAEITVPCEESREQPSIFKKRNISIVVNLLKPLVDIPPRPLFCLNYNVHFENAQGSGNEKLRYDY